jgi:predicted small secreted protein
MKRIRLMAVALLLLTCLLASCGTGDVPSGGSGGGGDSSGGGVLVVTDGKDSLDKTWQEISNAMHAGGIVVLVYEESEDYVTQNIISAATPRGDNWSLWIVPHNPANDPADLTCASPDDYPVWA